VLREKHVAKRDVHVTPREDGDGWKVERSGSERASSVHRTQAEAETEGRRLARADEVEFFLHGRDGRIRERDTYGQDPYPPKG
jgi:uncharacterized protein DUF2188